MTPKPHHLADFKRAKRRINLIMAYLYLPVSDVGSIYSKRFKK